MKKTKLEPALLDILKYESDVDKAKDIFIKWKSLRGTTLERMLLRHGPIVGIEKWNSYREKQAYSNTFEYKNKKYGWSKEKFNEFNKSRAVTLDNLIAKHGVEKGTKKYNAYCKRQAYVGNSLEYFIEKYGIEKGTEKYKSVNKLKAINIENMQRVHGKKEGIQAYEKWLNADRLGTKYYSPISQELFWSLYDKLSDKDQIKFGEYNKEQFLWKDKEVYTYDFKYKNKIIEFNGEHCHPNKEKLTNEEFKNWRCCFTGKNAEEKLNEDVKKINIAKDRGFKVLVIWYYDYINDKENTIQKALEFLKE